MNKQDVIISLLKEIDKNIDNINDSGGTNANLKVKVGTFTVTNDCINEDGRWEGESLIDTSEISVFQSTFENNSKITHLDASNWNTSRVNNTRWMFRNCTNLEEINVTNWDMSKVSNIATGFALMFYNTTNLKKIIGINSWKSNITPAAYDNFIAASAIEELDLSGYKGVVGNASGMFYQCYHLHTLNISDLDVSKCNIFSYCFGLANSLKELDLTKWDMGAAQNTNYMFWKNYSLISIVGGRNIDDVIINNIGVMNGVKQLSSTTFVEIQSLDRASLRALINGLADLTGNDTQTLTLGETLIAKLTEEDIAIATAKNWTIA